MHGYMTRTFDHYLTVVFPGDLCQLAECFQFSKLRFVIRVGNRAGTQAVAQAKRNVVRRHDLADVSEARVEKTFLMMSETPLGHDRATSTYDPRRPTRSHRDVRKPHAGVYGEV